MSYLITFKKSIRDEPAVFITNPFLPTFLCTASQGLATEICARSLLRGLMPFYYVRNSN